jgi:hypothetical protein
MGAVAVQEERLTEDGQLPMEHEENENCDHEVFRDFGEQYRVRDIPPEEEEGAKR